MLLKLMLYIWNRHGRHITSDKCGFSITNDVSYIAHKKALAKARLLGKYQTSHFSALAHLMQASTQLPADAGANARMKLISNNCFTGYWWGRLVTLSTVWFRRAASLRIGTTERKWWDRWGKKWIWTRPSLWGNFPTLPRNSWNLIK